MREIGEGSRQLKALASELNCPVVCLAQLNRTTTAVSDKRPTMAHLRASGEIEQNADDVWLLHREDYYNPGKPKTHLVEMIIGKARNAQAGETLHFRNKFAQMHMTQWEGDLPGMGDEPEPGKPKGPWAPQKGGRDRQAKDN